jgi:phage recombination protein Bet
MTTAIQRTSVTSIARQQDGLTDDQIKLITDTIAKGANKEELALFIQTCNRLRLDPFARQIFLVKRWDSSLRREVATSQVSIDGFRLVAERTGQYRGQTAPQWCGKDGKWVDVWLADENPAAARVGVYRDGFAEPLYRVARFASYAQTKKEGGLTKMWATMPDVMIAKCAESLALRAAFPNELGGVYTAEEMGQAEQDRPARANGKPARTLDDVAAPVVREMSDAAEMALGTENVIDAEFDEQTGEIEPSDPPKAPECSCPLFLVGKHKGQSVMDVPVGYLRWMKQQEGYQDRTTPEMKVWVEYACARHEWEKGNANG